MATKKKSAAKTKLPSGYAPARQSLDGFFTRDAGNTIEGKLRRKFTVSSGKYGPKAVYVIEVTKGETQVGQDGELLGAGSLIGLDETGFTKSLGELEMGTQVFIRYEGKDPDEMKGRKVVRNGAHRFTVGVATDE